MVGFYEFQLIILVSLCFIFLLVERHVSRRKELKEKDLHTAERLEDGEPTTSNNFLSTLTRQYLTVYAIVMGMHDLLLMGITWSSIYPGADWLQGPYVYSLYREQYGLPERMVAVLFVTGFMSAGLTAPLVGVWADQQYVTYALFTAIKLFD